MIKGIAFDKDGTLLDNESFWMPVAENAVRLLIAKHKLDADCAEEMLSCVGAYDGIEGALWCGTYSDIARCFNQVLNELGQTKKITREETADAFVQSIGCGRLVPVCENIKEVFAELKSRNIRVVLITSDNKKMAEMCLKELGILEFFDRVYADDGINPSKPEPYHMNVFLKDFSLKPCEVLMVGDTLTDMEFAKNSGVKAVGVAKTEKDRNILKTMTDTVVNDISHIFEVTDNANDKV